MKKRCLEPTLHSLFSSLFHSLLVHDFVFSSVVTPLIPSYTQGMACTREEKLLFGTFHANTSDGRSRNSHRILAVLHLSQNTLAVKPTFGLHTIRKSDRRPLGRGHRTWKAHLQAKRFNLNSAERNPSVDGPHVDPCEYCCVVC